MNPLDLESYTLEILICACKTLILCLASCAHDLVSCTHNLLSREHNLVSGVHDAFRAQFLVYRAHNSLSRAHELECPTKSVVWLINLCAPLNLSCARLIERTAYIMLNIEPRHSNSCKIAGAPSEDCEQPAHSHSLSQSSLSTWRCFGSLADLTFRWAPYNISGNAVSRLILHVHVVQYV